jgi:manganese/zinc/iron transport system permease protein
LLMGNPDALQACDISIVCWSTLFILGVGILLLKGFSCAIFDPAFASFSGFRPALFINLLLALVALASVSAFRAVGFIMTLSFFVFPPLIARRFTRCLPSFLGLSVFVGCTTVFVAVALGRHLFSVYFVPVSTGALSATLLAVFFCLLVGYSFIRARMFRLDSMKKSNSLS